MSSNNVQLKLVSSCVKCKQSFFYWLDFEICYNELCNAFATLMLVRIKIKIDRKDLLVYESSQLVFEVVSHEFFFGK